MKVFIGLNSHTNKVSLPLRFGVQLTERNQQLAELSNPVFDAVATDLQRPDEIARMRKHYRGRLVIPRESAAAENPYELDCRIVLELPADESLAPVAITVLSSSATKGDATVTRHLEGMLKKGRISTNDLLDVFHPAYTRGEISDSTDCEDIFRAHIERAINAIHPEDALGQEVAANGASVVRLVEEVADAQEELEGPPKFSDVIPLKSKYQYVFADAYVSDVWVSDGRINIKCIGSNGEVTLKSFGERAHLAEHHQRAYRYLAERKSQRAVFAVCVSEPYKGTFAESVTSIALELMRTPAARSSQQSGSVVSDAATSSPRAGTWESQAASLFFENNPSLMTDDEYEMIYGHER